MYKKMFFGILFLFFTIFLTNFSFAEDFDLKTIVSISPSSPDSGDIVKVKCVVENLGEDVEFDELEITFYMNGEHEEDETESYDDESLDKGDKETYSFEFETDEDDTEIEFGCEITDYDLDADYDEMTDKNEDNDSSYITVETDADYDSKGIDLGISKVSVDDDEPLLGQEIEITCTYINYGNDDADNDDGDIDLYWYIDGKKVDTTKISSIDSGSKKTKKYLYTIPLSYDNDELEVGCKINWDPDDSDDEDTENDNDKKTIEIEVDTTNIYEEVNITNYINNLNYPNLKLDLATLNSVPPIVNQSNKIKCVIQNTGQKATIGNYTIETYVDSLKIDSKIISESLAPFNTYTYETTYTFLTTGYHLIKCNVIYNSVETNTSDNSKQTSYYIMNQENKTYNNTTKITNNTSIELKKAIPKMNSIIINSREGHNANITCNYSNIGNTTMNNYNIIITLNNVIYSNETINTALNPNESTNYNKELNVGYNGGQASCKIYYNEQTSIASTNLKSNFNYTWTIIIGIVIILGFIIYFMFKPK